MRRLLTIVLFVLGCPGDDGAPSGGGTTAGTSESGSTTATSVTGDPTSTTGAQGTTSTTGDPPGSSESSDGYIPIDCTEHCSDLGTPRGTALCYACRCKNAMDGYMPPVDQIQCSEADPLTIYTVDLSGPEAQLVPLEEERTVCANPSLLTDSCALTSRLGQLNEGDIYLKWVCRDPDPATGIYADAGLIMHNQRNGATCWFDDVDEVTSEDDFPDLDLLEAGEENLEAYLQNFYFTDGSSCSSACHSADPFAYTDYLRSVEWPIAAYVTGPYSLVQLNGTLAPVSASHLMTPDTVRCAMCHRLDSAAGCSFLHGDAMGSFKFNAHEQAVVDAIDPGSPNWHVAYWMPKGGDPITSLEMWDDLYGAAKTRLTECCEAPGVDSPNCTWEPIPGGD